MSCNLRVACAEVPGRLLSGVHAIALTLAKGGSSGQPASPYAPVSSDILIWGNQA